METCEMVHQWSGPWPVHMTAWPEMQRCAPRKANSPAVDEPTEKTTAELLRENMAMRRELAKLQGVQPDEVCQ